MSELRKHPSTPARGTRGCTIIKSFNLSKGKKRTFDEVASAYVPIAQQVEAFHKRTLNRYHLRNKKDQSLLPSKSMNKIPRDPQAPILQIKYSTRVVTCKSAAQQEAEELEKLQQYKIKARELDPRIFESGRGTYQERQLQEKIKELQKGEVPKFTALPVSHFDAVNLPEKKVKNVTQAEPFSLETDKRGAHKAEIWKHQLEEEQKQQKKQLTSRLVQTPSSFKSSLFPRKRKNQLLRTPLVL